MPNINGAGRSASAHSSPDLTETQVIPVVPLKDKPGVTIEHIADALGAETLCEHVAWEVTGHITPRPGETEAMEVRKCSDCGHRWTASIPGPSKEDLAEAREALGVEESAPQPPEVVYGGGRIVTYQTKRGQYDLIVDEIAMVSVQNGMLVVQHPQADVIGIVGVRPWLREEEKHAADAEG